MCTANEMRAITNQAMNDNEEFNKMYDSFMKKIREKAMAGEREISWYDNPVYYDFKNPNKNKLLEMLKNKLSENGFKYVYGYQIGKPIGNSQSEYIVW
jgi:hypothetical protein